MSRRPARYRFTRKRFDKKFPDGAACLEWLRQYLYPKGIFCEKCQRITKHHRVAGRQSYSCDHCGRHVHPTSGTIYYRSHVPLKTWFYVIYLVTEAEDKISATQIQRETAVTYKTAWGMLHRIRHMLSEETEGAATP
jgi:transposase-like protein